MYSGLTDFPRRANPFIRYTSVDKRGGTTGGEPLSSLTGGALWLVAEQVQRKDLSK